MAATTALREALNQGISSGSLIDTKIILYSYRDSSGRVCRPKALYTNSHVLRTVPHFDGVLFGNFAESQSKDFSKEGIDKEEDYGYLSDSDLEDDEDEKYASLKPASGSGARPFDPFAVPGEEKVVWEEHEEHVEKGKVIEIPDVAFVTFQAFLMYLYTDTIEFAPFGSEDNRRSRSAEIVTPPDDKVPRPSPKSIYRFADKYDVPALKTLALNHIRSEVGKCEIIEESFSLFAFQYDEVRSLYINQLACAWMEDSTTESIRASVKEKVNSFAQGNLKHAGEALSALWEIVNKDEDIKASSNTSPATAQVTSPANWAAVKAALAKSLCKGVFFDRKYWAINSKTGDVLKPVYFSSIVMDDKVHQLSKLVKYLKGGNAPIKDLKENVNIESDCEGDLTGTGDGTLKKEEEEEKEEKSHAVLITGSFSAWKSLFFYRCTDKILFAPLKSQGIGTRVNYIRENTVTTAPLPCSPKSIYVLANLLGMVPLRDSAFANIKSKVSLENVVDEVFSRITASQEKILEMQCDLLISTFQDPKTIKDVKGSIGHISDGSSSHCADALNLGLEKAFNLKKKKQQPPPGVQLKCSYSSCRRGWYSTPAPYSEIGTNVYCPSCNSYYGNNYYMLCAGCNYQRTSSYTSCQSCKKNFV